MADTRREELSAAFDELSAADAGGGSESTGIPEGVPAVIDSELDAIAANDNAEASETAQAPADKPENVDRPKAIDRSGRDDKGRFAQKAAETQPAKAQPSATPDNKTAPAPVAKLAAPQSWKADVRDSWAALPPRVQQEIARRESETSVAMQRAAEATKQWEQVQRVVSPFEGMIRAEGGEPVSAIGSLLQTAAALRTSPPAHKARIVADLIRQYGIDHNHLADALTGQPANDNREQQGQYRDPRVDQLMAQMQAANDNRVRAIEDNGRKTIEEFSKTHEFVEDVREEMAQFLAVAKATGRNMTLDDAYSRAVQLHPDVSAAIAQRAAKQKAETALAATRRARAASSSVRSDPAGPSVSGGPKDRRSQLEDAFEELSGR